MDFVYYILLIAILLLANVNKIEAALLKHDSKIASKDDEIECQNYHAHSLVMATGEILSRSPTERYPDMETNQNKIKLYYKRSIDSPVNIHKETVEKVIPILRSVK
jgi:hypothetical protein